MPKTGLSLHQGRLQHRIAQLANIGAAGKGCTRLALTAEDKAARDLVVAWMEELELAVTVDQIGNIIAVEQDVSSAPPVMTGSHLDTVVDGGRYDGSLGVVAGLEAVRILRDTGARNRRPLAVAVFTNEEGVRYQPDMMGSLVYVGGLPLDRALATTGIDGSNLERELRGIGYYGDLSPGHIRPHAFIELHIEQGPVLQTEGLVIGAVESVQGILWIELSLTGMANHAGTTPIEMRRDAGLVAARIVSEMRQIALGLDGQLATVGSLEIQPSLINVIPGNVRMKLDLRNIDSNRLIEAEHRILAFARAAATEEKVVLDNRQLARSDPVTFDDRVVQLVEDSAHSLGLPCRRMASGAGHDAQMLARIAPSAMIFVPSADGVSHNPSEFTGPDEIEAGTNVLLQVLDRLTRE